MRTQPLPDQRAYIARMALELGATLIAYGSTRAEARYRLIRALEHEFGPHYARTEAASAAPSPLET